MEDVIKTVFWIGVAVFTVRLARDEIAKDKARRRARERARLERELEELHRFRKRMDELDAYLSAPRERIFIVHPSKGEA
jgi:hypothetical protein